MVDSCNGLVQGDPISVIILNSLVTCVVEAASRLPYPALCLSTYADDLSAVARGETLPEVQNGLRAVHAVVRGYVASGCGEVNERKCFTFGDVQVRGLLHHGFQHLDDFRTWWFVGGSGRGLLCYTTRTKTLGQTERQYSTDSICTTGLETTGAHDADNADPSNFWARHSRLG